MICFGRDALSIIFHFFSQQPPTTVDALTINTTVHIVRTVLQYAASRTYIEHTVYTHVDVQVHFVRVGEQKFRQTTNSSSRFGFTGPLCPVPPFSIMER
jgi:hypothetical protein